VVVGDGEVALHEYVSGRPYRDIPNLCYRGPLGVVANPEITIDLESLPPADYRGLPLEKYFHNFERRYADFKPFKKSLPVYSRKGCVWRDASRGGCIFCMIPHRGVRYKSPERYWMEIGLLEEKYGVHHFWEVCDTFTENSHWIDELVLARPAACQAQFNVYGRAGNISRHMARQLRRLGVYEVFIGAESGDDALLNAANKGTTTDQVRRAVDLLAEQDIQVVLSFVLGLPGESSETLQKTVDFAQELYSRGNIVETSTSILLPIPGSTAFERLMTLPGMATKHGGDPLDLEELKTDWIKLFTNTSSGELQQTLTDTWRMFPLNNTFWQRDAASAPCC
jgi:anaerobic magnesium-protoporphyrin IX monomethyl ester cyclase